MATGFRKRPVTDIFNAGPDGPVPEGAPIGTIRSPITTVAGSNPAANESTRVGTVAEVSNSGFNNPKGNTGFRDQGYGQTPPAGGSITQERGGIKLTGGSRNFGASSQSRTTVSSTILPSGALPTYTAPKRDAARVRSLRGKFAATGIRNLRRGLQQALTRQYENPNVRALNVRAVLQGFGAGLGNVLQQADIQANRVAENEFRTEVQESQINFQAALGKYNAGVQRVTTTGVGQVAGTNNTVFGTPVTDVRSRPGQIDYLNPTVPVDAPPGPRPRVFGGKK